MSETAEGEATVTALAEVQGQLIMPFYIVCDVSGSMGGDIGDLNAALHTLKSDIMANPVVDDLTMLSVITFQSSARTVVPLSSPSEIDMPTLTAGGGTHYGAAFREYHRAFEADRARLKREGKKMYRPCVFFLSDGEPLDPDYLAVFRSLFAYNPKTGLGNKAFPYVVTFGFRDARLETMRQLAYPDFGNSRGRWFLARSNKVGELLRSMTSAIGNTVVSSGMSAAVGKPQITAPALDTSSDAQFGAAGDIVND